MVLNRHHMARIAVVAVPAAEAKDIAARVIEAHAVATVEVGAVVVTVNRTTSMIGTETDKTRHQEV